MRSKSRFRPLVESMESRALLSMATASPDTPVLISAPVVAQAGIVRGTYLQPVLNPFIADMPAEYRVALAGPLGSLGRVGVAGSIFVGGFKAPGSPDSGTLTVSNARGSFTLLLTGTVQLDTQGRATAVMDARITAGTGAYTNLRLAGTATLRIGANLAHAAPQRGLSALGLVLYPISR
jgi:hypothetical protein